MIVGCGVVGATLAYELSRCSEFQVTVVDASTPASGSTGAALGVLMAVISQRGQGRSWRLREQSLRRYQTLLPELEEITGQPIPRNSQGILSLCFAAEEVPRWQSLQAIRQQQGYLLELWSPAQVSQRCPHLNSTAVALGIYSPADLQVQPRPLTEALVAAATRQGVSFYFEEPVQALIGPGPQTSASGYCRAVNTAARSLPADWVVITAGLGSLPLTQALGQPIALGPVLGQAVRLHLDHPLGDAQFQPVVNGHDIHLVPLGGGDYWVGATVEFPATVAATSGAELRPAADRLQEVLAGALAYCPSLAQGTIVDRWFGLRPRPQGQAAPVIQPLAGYRNLWVATGHYRNGVLLAPATAIAVRDQLLSQLPG